MFGWSDNGPEKSLEREILKRPLKIMPDSGQSAAGNSVTVAVRVRPMNKREIGLGTKCCIEMDGNQTILQSPNNTVHKQNKVSSNASRKIQACSTLNFRCLLSIIHSGQWIRLIQSSLTKKRFSMELGNRSGVQRLGRYDF